MFDKCSLIIVTGGHVMCTQELKKHEITSPKPQQAVVGWDYQESWHDKFLKEYQDRVAGQQTDKTALHKDCISITVDAVHQKNAKEVKEHCGKKHRRNKKAEQITYNREKLSITKEASDCLHK